MPTEVASPIWAETAEAPSWEDTATPPTWDDTVERSTVDPATPSLSVRTPVPEAVRQLAPASIASLGVQTAAEIEAKSTTIEELAKTEMLQTPLVKVPKPLVEATLPIQALKVISPEAATGLTQGIIEVIEGTTTPESIAVGAAIAGIAAANPVAGAMLASGVGAKMTGEAAGTAVAAAERGDVQEFARNVPLVAAGALMTVGPGSAAIKGGLKPTVSEVAASLKPIIPKSAEALRQTVTELKSESSKPPQMTEAPAVEPAKPLEPTPTVEPPNIEAAVVPEQQPELIGMGGAVLSEFALSPKSPTSIKNAKVDAERLQRGLPPAVEPIRRDFGQVWDKAMAEIDRDPGITDRLLNDLREKPRALTDVEDALILERQVDLHNEYGKATRDLAQAFDDGRFEDVTLQQARVEGLSNQLLDLYDIGKAAGTETGRGLAARKMMVNEDFSLATLELQKRADLGGRQLTPSERTELVRVADEFKAKSEALEQRLAMQEERMGNMVFREAYDNLLKEVEQQPKVSPHIIQIAERIVGALDKQADAARTRLRGKLFTLSPDVLYDLGVIGASHIGRVGLDFAKWSVEMTKDIGERISPHLQTVWKRSQELIDEEASKFGQPVVEPVKRRVKKQDVAEQQASITDKLKAKSETADLGELGSVIQKLARHFVAQGIKERGALVDAVHAEVQKVLPEFTRRDTMDAISGYGQFKQLSKDEISVQLRDLKGQLQQVAKLEDMQAGQAPKKTGVERRSPSDEERRLIKQVEEAKKKGGYKVTDPATQLRTALQSIKTRLRNQISDLEQQITTKTRIVPEKRTVEYDAEAKALKDVRDVLKEQYDNLFGKRELTDAQRIEIAMKAVEKSIAEYERRITSGDIAPKKLFSKTPETPDLKAARARRDALKEQLQELRDIANPKKTPEERALQAFKVRTKNRVAELEERMATGNFTPKPRKELPLDPEATRLKFELEKVKERWVKARFDDQQQQRSLPRKIFDTGRELINFSRAVITSVDLSAVLRQGGFITIGNPVKAVKALGPMFRAMRSKDAQFAIMDEIKSRKNYPLYKQSKLYLAEDSPISLTKMEEAYMSRWADRTPVVAASQRAYVTFLNRLRADTFDSLTASLSKTGTPTAAEAAAIANYINVATGRGGTWNQAAVGLNTVFFSPRLVASRFQLLAGSPLYRGTSRTRKLIAKEYGKFLIGTGIIYAIGQLAGADIEFDTRSSDFGKLKFGNTRLDPLAGLSQVTVLLGRLGAGETKTLSGEIRPIRGDVPFGASDSADVIARFLRTKLSPSFGQTIDALTGTDVVGQPVTAGSIAQNLLVPMSFDDIREAVEEQGVPKGVALSLLSLFGMSMKTIDPDEPKPEREP